MSNFIVHHVSDDSVQILQTNQRTTKPTKRPVRSDSYQLVHPPSMAGVLDYPSLDSLEAMEGNAISKDSDQTARMRRLI